MKILQSHQTLLGITPDLLQRQVCLKPGKTKSVSEFTDNILFNLFWDKKSLESLCGNTVWLSMFSMLLLKLRSYIAPALEIIKRIPGKTCTFQKGLLPSLDAETSRSLLFIRTIFKLDPAIHVWKYLNLLPTHKSVLWCDASGFERDSNNPTSGRLGSPVRLHVHKRLASHFRLL